MGDPTMDLLSTMATAAHTLEHLVEDVESRLGGRSREFLSAEQTMMWQLASRASDVAAMLRREAERGSVEANDYRWHLLGAAGWVARTLAVLFMTVGVTTDDLDLSWLPGGGETTVTQTIDKIEGEITDNGYEAGADIRSGSDVHDRASTNSGDLEPETDVPDLSLGSLQLTEADPTGHAAMLEQASRDRLRELKSSQTVARETQERAKEARLVADHAEENGLQDVNSILERAEDFESAAAKAEEEAELALSSFRQAELASEEYIAKLIAVEGG